jgi:putative ABC transport system substrate-binding protein
MTTRRMFIRTLAGGLLAAPLVTEAQPPTKLGRIAVVVPSAGRSSVMDAFYVGLREAGYIEGRNITIDHRSMAGRENEYDLVMAELEQRRVDVIFAAGPPAALAAKRVVKVVPVVFAAVGDPVAIGLVESLARPGANMTGVAFDVTPEIAAKRLAILKEAVPGVDRIAALWSSTDPVGLQLLRKLESAAQQLHVSVKAYDVRRPEDLESVFEGALKDRPNGILVVGGPVNVIHQKRIIAFAETHRLPSISISRNYAEDGGLMSYGPRFADQWRLGAAYVARILRGAKPADLPVEQPTKFELVINTKTAKALGLTIPQSLLLRADEVIQ